MAGGHEIVGSSPTSPTIMKIITHSVQETEEFGATLSAKLTDGSIVLLSGNLGAGKTALVKGIAKGLGIKNTITSPTFTLMNVYQIKQKQSRLNELIHIDTYRLKNENELIEIGVEDYLGKPHTICVIEWPEKIEKLLQKYNTKNFISIEIKQLENPEEREITLKLP